MKESKMKIQNPNIRSFRQPCLHWLALVGLVSTLNYQAATVLAQGTAFSYQGQLSAGGKLANGVYDLQFSLYDTLSGGNRVAGPITNSVVTLSNGLFTTSLDFGTGVFNGRALWLEIGARTNATGSFAILTPRQALTPAPYALFAPAAGAALTASNVVLGAVCAPNLNTPVNPLPGQVLAYDGNSLTWTNPPATGGAWLLGGNAGTSPGANFLGTRDNQPLELKVNGQRAARFEPNIGGMPNVICGASNTILLSSGVAISGGGFNTTTPIVDEGMGYFSTNNVAFSTISGGYGNLITGYGGCSSIGGGCSNTVFGWFWQPNLTNGTSVIGGGCMNTIYTPQSVIGGGQGNGIGSGGIMPWVEDQGSAHVIGGGIGNRIGYETHNSTIGGGYSNYVAASSSTIAGGFGNSINFYWAGPSSGDCIGGGVDNSIYSPIGYCTISGGRGNSAGSSEGYGTVSGGQDNAATGYAIVSGGLANSASGLWSSVSGGRSNSAAGAYSVVPGGFKNVAQGANTFAAGSLAQAVHSGSFVWASGNTTDYRSDDTNTFNIYAAGGVLVHYGGQNGQGVPQKWIVLASRLPDRVINVYNGAYLSATGVWTDNSDRNAKHNFSAVDGKEILDQVAALPITSWSYKTDDSVRHIGPVAQDFHDTFGVGQDDKHIAALDSAGIALAAIQGLNQVVREKDAEIKELKQSVEELKAMVNRLAQKSEGRKQ
jgi:trimeric autotransporter adhesin